MMILAGTLPTPAPAPAPSPPPAVAPTKNSDPVISGTAVVGQTLTCAPGSYSGNPTPSVTRQWKSAATSGGSLSDITGATSTTYTLQAGEEAEYIKCVETASNTEGSVTGTSNEIGPIADAGDPTALPLVQEADLTYVGAIRMPDLTGPDDDIFAYTDSGFAINPSGNDGAGSFFVPGKETTIKVAEISIPTPVNAGSVSSLNRATLLQGLTVLDNGFTSNLGTQTIDNQKQLGGLLVHNNELWGNIYAFYDGAGYQVRSLFKGPLTLAQATRTGVYGKTNGSSAVPGIHWVNRYLGHIPTEWQALFGGPCFAGASTGFSSIRSLQSNGPAFSVFDPASLTGTSHGSTVEMNLALGYPVGNELGPYGEPDAVWNETSSPAGAILPAGTRSVLFFGSHGGIDEYDYPPGDDDGPFKPYVWAYDANDLLEVLAGTTESYEVQPYGVWDLSSKIPIDGWSWRSIKGVAIHPTTNRFYVLCGFQDGTAPVIHAFDVEV